MGPKLPPQASKWQRGWGTVGLKQKPSAPQAKEICHCYLSLRVLSIDSQKRQLRRSSSFQNFPLVGVLWCCGGRWLQKVQPSRTFLLCMAGEGGCRRWGGELRLLEHSGTLGYRPGKTPGSPLMTTALKTSTEDAKA